MKGKLSKQLSNDERETYTKVVFDSLVSLERLVSVTGHGEESLSAMRSIIKTARESAELLVDDWNQNRKVG